MPENFVKAADESAQNPILAAQLAKLSDRPSAGDRSRSPRDNDKVKSSTDDDFDAAFLAAFDRNAKTINTAVTKGVSESIQEPIKDTVREVCKEQYSSFDGRLQSLEDGQARMGSDISDIKETLKKLALGRSIGTEESSSHPVRVTPTPADFEEHSGESQNPTTDSFGFIPNQEFWRRPNPTVLYTNMHESKEVSKEKSVEAFSKLASEANCGPTTYKVYGDEP